MSPFYFLSAAIKRKCIQKNQAFCKGEELGRILTKNKCDSFKLVERMFEKMSPSTDDEKSMNEHGFLFP